MIFSDYSPRRAAYLAACAAVTSVVTGAHTASAQEFLAKDVKVKAETLVALDNPWALAELPDGAWLVTEKPGRLRIFKNGSLSEPVAGVPQVAFRKQGGLLGIAADPDFKTNNIIYLSYAEAATEQPANPNEQRDERIGPGQELDDTVLKGLAVARAKLNGNKLEDVKVIWQQQPKMIGRGHFGGALVFAPDGTLIITSGERQRFEPAQDKQSTAGKIIRINRDGSIPTDNPFAKSAGPDAGVWSMGHRNPLGAVYDTRGRLWVHEMGPKGGDELNLIVKGGDFGWPSVSDGKHYNDVAITPHAEKPQFKKPALSWTPVISPAGFAVYTGSQFSAWKGKGLIGGLSSQGIVIVSFKGKRAMEYDRLAMNMRVRDVAAGNDGAIYVLKDGNDGALIKLSPVKGPASTN